MSEKKQATEMIKENKPAKKPADGLKKSGGNPFKSTRFKRGGLSVVMSVIFVAVVVVVNIMVTILADRFPSINVDLTSNNLNTLSEDSIEVAKDVSFDTTITFLTGEDDARNDRIFSKYASYGFKYSQIVNLADRLQEINSKIKVEFVDPDMHPEIVDQYDDPSMGSGAVIVSTEKRYKVLSPLSDLFTAKQNQQTQEVEYYSKADSGLANAINNVNLADVPTIAVATGHNEMLSDANLAAFQKMLSDKGYDWQTFNIITEDIPAEADVVLLPTPSSDYTKDEIDTLRAFLSDETATANRTLMLTCYPSQGTLPVLGEFLEEWGVRLESGIVVETDTNRVVLNSLMNILGDATDAYLSDGSYGQIYSAYTSPLSVLFDYNDDVSVYKLWQSSETAAVATGEEETVDGLMQEQQTLATLSSKSVKKGDLNLTENVVVFGSSLAFIDGYVNNDIFGNKQYLMDFMSNMTGMEVSSVYIPDIQTNAIDVATSAGTLFTLLFVVFTVVVPVVLLVAGLVIFLRRRYL